MLCLSNLQAFDLDWQFYSFSEFDTQKGEAFPMCLCYFLQNIAVYIRKIRYVLTSPP